MVPGARALDLGQAEASHVDGTWMIRDLVLNIFDCQRAVCGRIDVRKLTGRC